MFSTVLFWSSFLQNLTNRKQIFIYYFLSKLNGFLSTDPYRRKNPDPDSKHCIVCFSSCEKHIELLVPDYLAIFSRVSPTGKDVKLCFGKGETIATKFFNIREKTY